MKILMINHTLHYYAGSETFTYTLAVELQRQGHEVICFSPRLGPLADQLRKQNISVTDDLAYINNIDVIHAHHRHEALLGFGKFTNTPMILVCHGILPWQEQPLKSKLNIFRYVAVSEEVRNHLIQNHHIDPSEIEIIRNGIDLDRFSCTEPIRPMPKHAVVVSNYMKEHQRLLIANICRQLNITLDIVGVIDKPIWNVESRLCEADIVFALGRTALEAMACKRNVIVYDYNGADGLVTVDNFNLLKQKNFSGRTHGVQYDDEKLLLEIKEYNPSNSDQVYEIIEKEYNIIAIARQYIELYTKALDDSEKNKIASRKNSLNCYLAFKEILMQTETLLLQQQHLKEKEKEVINLSKELSDQIVLVRSLENDLQERNVRLNNIYESNGYKSLALYYRIRDIFFPTSSMRRKIAKSIWKFFK